MTNPRSHGESLRVVLADGESAFALPVLRCLASASDVRTTVIARAPWAPIRFSRHRQRFVFIDKKGDDARLDAIARIAAEENADVVMAAGQRTIRLLAAHSHLKTESTRFAHSPDTAAFDVASDKWCLARFLDERGIAHPQTILYRHGEEFREELASLEFPVLIKPATGGSGHGIEYFKTPTELLAFFADRRPPERYVVQSFVRGYDIDASILAVDGRIIAHTIQREFLPGYRRFGPPAGVDFVHDTEVLDLARRLVTALDWSGIAHIDMRFDQDAGHVKIIEMNPRYWGSLLGSLIAGVNFPHIACRAAVGTEVPQTEYADLRYVAGRAAMDRYVKRLFTANGAAQGLTDRTCVGLVMRDPLPDVFGPLLRRKATA